MDPKLIADLCALARLDLSEAERADFAPKFAGLLGFVEVIQQYKSESDAPPLALIEELALRRDIPEPFTWPEGYVHNYRVPQVIDFGEGGG